MILIGDIGQLMDISKFFTWQNLTLFSQIFLSFHSYINETVIWDEVNGILLDDFKTIRHPWKLQQLQSMMTCKNC